MDNAPLVCATVSLRINLIIMNLTVYTTSLNRRNSVDCECMLFLEFDSQVQELSTVNRTENSHLEFHVS